MTLWIALYLAAVIAVAKLLKARLSEPTPVPVPVPATRSTPAGR